MKTSLRGLYKIYYDANYAAIDIIDDNSAVLFKGQNGRYNLDPIKGSIDDVSESASFIKVSNDSTLKEASDAFLEKRKPRWYTKKT